VFFDACGATSTAPPGEYRCCANYSCIHGTLTPFELPLPVDSGGWYNPTFSVLDAGTSDGSIAHAIACGSASVSIDQTPVSWTGNVFPPNPAPCLGGGACYTSYSAGWVNVPANGTLITACYMGAHEWAGTGACNDLIGAAWGGVSW
jgi:hypothetical protein